MADWPIDAPATRIARYLLTSAVRSVALPGALGRSRRANALAPLVWAELVWALPVLAAQLAQLENQLAASEKKLSNESFISKASPDVVERERDRLAELQKQIESVQANLEDLRGE